MRPPLPLCLGAPARSLAPVCRFSTRVQPRLTASPSYTARRHFTASRQRCLDNSSSSSSGTAQGGPAETLQRPRRRRRGVWIAAAILVAGGASWIASDAAADAQLPDDGSSSHRTGSSLNPETFVPFQVVARETVSPTAFVLTLRLPRIASPESRAATRQHIDKAWQHGLWSVEVKQPQLQIARDYTPLPALGVLKKDDVELRIFVRTVPGGEVSRYLSQRVVGSTVDVRGPKLGFDVASRLTGRGGHAAAAADTIADATDKNKKMVILAGGTGIATALQAASSVLSTLPAAAAVPVTILWANRLGQDSVGLDGGGGASLANPVVRDLRALQTRFGADRVRVLSYVDAQQTFIRERDVHALVSGASTQRGWLSWLWPFASSAPSPPATVSLPLSASAAASAQPCVYHSKTTLEQLESDPEYGSARAYCLCKTKTDWADRTRAPSSPGTSLVLVSGPEGFVSAWAGPKTWTAGLERQGPVGGILGAMAAKDAKVAEWQVLKL